MPTTHAGPPSARADTSDRVTLEELNAQYIRSIAHRDTDWFAQHLSVDFLNSNPDGSLVDRSGFLAQVARPSAISNLRCEDVRIRIFGDIAIIHARTAYHKSDGHPGAGRYTDIWRRHDGGWVCIAAHVTRG